MYLLGPRPTNVREWSAVELPAGWGHDVAGHYLEGTLPVFRFRRDDGTRVELHRAAAWFGEHEPAADDAAEALHELGRLFAGAFDDGQLLATPSATGRYLLMRSIAFGQEWPTMTAEQQQLVRSTSGQGRIELFPRTGDVERIVSYDGRFMYGALCWGLPGGVPVQDHVDEFAGYQKGRYHVTATVPAGWNGPGILGAMVEGGGWRWPSNPGEKFTTWCDGAELAIAFDHGWSISIHERLLFPSYTTKGPADVWSDKLVKMREAFTHESEAVTALVRAGIRAVVLHSIGAFHGRPHKVTRMGSADDVPAEADGLRIEGETFLWAEASAGQAWPEMAHPEWSAAVWGRARARLLSAPTGTKNHRAGLLHVDPSTVLAVRTDAVYLTTDPGWPDDGKTGRFRKVSEAVGPMPAPRSHAELLAVR